LAAPGDFPAPFGVRTAGSATSITAISNILPTSSSRKNAGTSITIPANWWAKPSDHSWLAYLSSKPWPETRITLHVIAIGTADAVMISFCHSGRADKNAIAAPTVMNVINDRMPAHASATLRMRTRPIRRRR